MAKPKDTNLSPKITNRRAFFDYFIDQKVECGLSLSGTEVKSLRHGKGQINDAFAKVDRGELWLYNAYIDPYEQAGPLMQHEPKRPRKLLVKKKEIARLEEAVRDPGTALIPLNIHWKDGRAKLELGVGRGKKKFDKREDLKKKAADREIRKAMSRR
ncbi:MAG: SsrA-binding protein SmpB [Phycisphaerae bacterium]